MSNYTNKTYFFLLTIFVFVGTLLFAGGNDTLVTKGNFGLNMQGHVWESKGQQRNSEKIPLDSADITVSDEAGKIIWAGITDSKGKLNIKLPIGKIFLMSFSKHGYVKKSISVDTHITGKPEKNFDFAYDIDIFEKIEGLDVSVLDSPVAKIIYKALDKSFSYDVAYTNKINSNIQKMYREYYGLLRKQESNDGSDSINGNSSVNKSGGIQKSVPYGSNKKPH